MNVSMRYNSTEMPFFNLFRGENRAVDRENAE